MAEQTALVQDWFEVREVETGVFLIGEPLHEENVKSYLVAGTERAVLIDTGMGIGDIKAVAEALTSLPIDVVNSHAHWDHVGGNWRFQRIACHRAEADDLTRGIDPARLQWFLADEHMRGPFPPGFAREGFVIPPSQATTILDGGETIDLGGRTLEVIHLPGHSPGGIALLDRAAGALFSTDVAYAGALYAQLSHSNLDDYRRSMKTLADLAPSPRVAYPSHGPSPIDPALFPQMSEALDQVADGRRPDGIEGGVAGHLFDGFSVLVPASGDASR